MTTNNTLCDVGMVDLLDNILREEAKNEVENPENAYKPLRPSSAGKCERALYYAYHEFMGRTEGEATPKSPETLRLLDLGHHVENSMVGMLQKLKKDFGIGLYYQQQQVDICTLNDGRILTGVVDFALENKDVGFKLLCDAKSAKDGFSNFYRTRWDGHLEKWARSKSLKQISDKCFIAEDAVSLVEELKDDFKTNNINQLNLYLSSDFFKNREYTYGSLFYYNKNDSRMYELRFRYSEELKRRVVKKFNNVIAVSNGDKKMRSAKKDYMLGSIRCAFCPYNKKCWGKKEDPKGAWFKTLDKNEPIKNIAEYRDEKLTEMFEEYENMLTINEACSTLEKDIIQLLYGKGIKKIRLDNNHVFEVKHLKSPKPHFVLRRGK